MTGSEEDEDDYMSMDFSNAPTNSVPETSLQRRQRLKREAEFKARPKSKAELAADEAAAREQTLATSLLEADAAAARKSKGLAMMKKMGFVAGARLGAHDNASGSAEPIRINMKEDRGGIGLDADRKRKMHEAAEREGTPWTTKKPKVDEGEFRDRMRRERDWARWERQVVAAQKTAEGMDEERRGRLDSGGDSSGTRKNKEAVELEPPHHDGSGAGPRKTALASRSLKSVNVFWRALVRQREEAERDRRMRHDMEQSLSRLPTYEDDEDEDDRTALGRSRTIAYAPVEDMDEEDPELDEFTALPPDERLRQLVEFMRREFRYCFWCKYTYPDNDLEGCPGLAEEDHD